MIGMERIARPSVAPPEEDPNATVVCSSPPCFLHELDPGYLGYLGRDEVLALLGELLAAEWPGTVLETAWLRVVLRRHLVRLGGTPFRDASGTASRPPNGGAQPDSLARRLREGLSRLQDEALRHDLQQLLGMMERDMRHHARLGPG